MRICEFKEIDSLEWEIEPTVLQRSVGALLLRLGRAR
jgi:hypothetical protein